RPRHAAAGWLLALLLAFAVFLTASRSAWVMVILALPPLLAFRPWGYALKVGALLAISGILGMATVMERAKPASGSQTTPPADGSATIHLGALVERGSAGRSSAYQILWNDLEDHRWFGKGLAVTREPVAHLLHEHSSYMATLRGGGIIALAAHGMLLACAFRAAILLFRNGCRWPLLLAITVFSGLLFDRSTVFKLSGFDEFPMHWLAVWIPIARWSHERNQLSILGKRNKPQMHVDGHGFSETSEKFQLRPENEILDRSNSLMIRVHRCRSVVLFSL
ncbi:MAG: O-antigen ligase family protein, partial [Luteolibacter sp.]